MRKIVQNIKKCPLIFMIILSVVLMSAYGIFGIISGKYEMNFSFEHPFFDAVLFKEYKIEDKMMENPILVDNKEEKKKQKVESSEKLDDEDGEEKNDEQDHPSKDGYETTFLTVDMRRAKSGYYSDNDKIALSTDCPYEKVDDSYFEDTAFIGDSRIEGFSDYAGINADCFYKEGLTVYKMFDEKISSKTGKSTTLKKALKKKSYKNIYIMIGINELGYKTTDKFKDQYQKNIEEIKELQPEARIIILGIMRMTTEHSERSKVFNNDNIDDKNRAIAELADGKEVFYLDMNPVVTDEDGGVISDYTWDGVHLKAEYYKLWADFMREHGYEDPVEEE